MCWLVFRLPARFLERLARCGCRKVLRRIGQAGGQLPAPRAGDEAVPQDEQDPVLVVLHRGEHNRGQAEQVVINTAPAGKFDVSDAHLFAAIWGVVVHRDRALTTIGAAPGANGLDDVERALGAGIGLLGTGSPMVGIGRRGMSLDLGGRRVSFEEMASSSFAEFLSSYAPHLIPGGALRDFPGGISAAGMLSHATTIVAVACDDGVVLASDRRATSGNMISKRDVDMVFRCDDFSAVGIAGVLALALEFAKLFQLELEHYEKMEGRSLSLEGKAHRLTAMIRGNLPLAMQGLVMIPLLAGYDPDSGTGRIFSYDPAGGPYEEHRFHSIGSGSVFANGALKKLYVSEMPASDAVL